MSLYKRKNIYWAEWHIGGQRVRESSGTSDREAANEWHDRRRAELWREAKIGDKPAIGWDAAALAWWREHAQHKNSAEDDRLRLRWVTVFLTGKAISAIDTALLTRIRDAKRASPATRNRHLAVISGVLHYALARGWLAAVPKIPYMKEPKGRIRWLTQDEARALIALLPANTAAMARFTLATGLRRHNCTHLEWSQVDLERRCAWVLPKDTKNDNRALAVPLNADAMAVLREQAGKHKRWVFPYRGKPVKDPGQVAWKRACKESGRPGFHWHDLRHTWASWHIQAGTPLEVLQRLGGWKSIDMVLRYSHLSPGFVAIWSENASINSQEHEARPMPSQQPNENVQDLGIHVEAVPTPEPESVQAIRGARN